MTLVRNYVDGGWVDSVSGQRGIRENPAKLDESVVEYPISDERDVRQAVDAGVAASDGWRRLSTPARAAMIAAALNRLEERAEEIALAITLENGKTLKEARGEVARSVAAGRTYLSLARTIDSRFVRNELPNVLGWSWYVPLGVVATITPWNYPLSTLIRKVVPALVMGNAVVHKPAEITPMSAAIVFEALDAAGLPPGVANLVLGPGARLGPALARSEAIRAISFTGSTAVGESLAAEVAGRDCRLQLEMGGKNALVVLSDASIDAAVNAAVVGSFTCSGQWCASTSRIVVEAPVHEAFIREFVVQVDALRLGDGRRADVDMGPLVSATQRDKVRQYVQLARRDLREVTNRAGACSDEGYFVAPAVFDGARPDHPLVTDEVFGPVVAVLRAKNPQEALEFAGASRYALTASIYTASLDRALEFVRESGVGRVAVNLPTYFGDPALPSVGHRASGRGSPESGEAGLRFFAQEQTVFMSPSR